jgi:hypothetical protein
MTRSLQVAVLLLLATVANAAPDRPSLLVLPLPPTAAVEPDVARAFDARLLVALHDSQRVVTVTPPDEPVCTTMPCLAELGAATGAALVLSLAAVREGDGVTLFGTVVDVATATAVRRIELGRVAQAELARAAPAALVPQIVGTPAGPPVLGFSPVGAGTARTAALALADQLAAQRGLRVVPLDGSDRASRTHSAELAIDELAIDRRRRVLCTWFEGTLVGTFTITELATGRVVFSKTVTATAERRAHFSSHEEITDLLVGRAVGQWMAAFRDARAGRLHAAAPANRSARVTW